jgi:predicted nuclease of predicted toxin-antitoxin system
MSVAPGGPDRDALLLDEMFSPVIAERLRARGVDCVAVAGDVLASQDDPVIADAALDAARVLVTNNVVDFEQLRRQRAASGDPMPLLVYTSDATFPRDRQFIGRLVDALEHAANRRLVRAMGGVLGLAPPSAGE